MDNVETWDEDVRKKLRAIPSAKAENPHHQQQQQLRLSKVKKQLSFSATTTIAGCRL